LSRRYNQNAKLWLNADISKRISTVADTANKWDGNLILKPFFSNTVYI